MGRESGAGKPPPYVETLEREEAALREKQARLRALRDAGEVTEDQYARRHRRLLERQATNELVLKGVRLAGDLGRWGQEDGKPTRRAPGRPQKTRAGEGEAAVPVEDREREATP